jgi:hypothetical protein
MTHLGAGNAGKGLVGNSRFNDMSHSHALQYISGQLNIPRMQLRKELLFLVG